MRNRSLAWKLLAVSLALLLAAILYWYVGALQFERYGFGVATEPGTDATDAVKALKEKKLSANATARS